MEDKTRITFRYERIRSVAVGVIETASNTFLLLIAVKWFQAGPTAKAIIAAASSIGYILSPAVVVVVSSLGITNTFGAALLFLVAACGYFLSTLVSSLPWFVFGGTLAVTSASMATPLLTQMFQENYPAEKRGKLFSRGVMIRIATAAAFSYVAGHFLDGGLHLYPWLMGIFVGAAFLSSFCVSSCPGGVLKKLGSINPLHGLRHVGSDRVFRNTLIAWMLLGVGNLVMRPLRVEYLANPKYGLDLTVAQVAFLSGVVPNIARFIMSPIWGSLFDRVNFFLLRMTLNTGFALGILSFFASDSMTGLVFAAVMFGIAEAGGDIAWSLWVTKFAPPEYVAEYMGVHSFFTGVRGVLAPFLAFWLAEQLSLGLMATFCASLILIASLMLIPEYRAQKRHEL